jgi:hypothetical protein
MNPNKPTRWFFASQKLYCPQCDDKSVLKKTIHIYGSVPFDEDYVASFYWDYDVSRKIFALAGHGNKSPNDHNVLFENHTIINIADVRAVCYLLNKNGYLIDEVRFIIDGCDNNCRFSHKYELEWFSDSNSLLLGDEWAKLTDYVIYNHYARDESFIRTTTPKSQTYSFDYVLNVDLKNYKSLKTKIQQILLLG